MEKEKESRIKARDKRVRGRDTQLFITSAKNAFCGFRANVKLISHNAL